MSCLTMFKEFGRIDGLLRNIEVAATCSKTATLLRSEFFVYSKTDTLGDIYAIDGSGNEMTVTCSNVDDGLGNIAESTGDGSSGSPVMFAQRIDLVTLIADSGPTCWKNKDAVTSQFTWTYRVMDPRITVSAAALNLPGLSFGEYTDYTFTCMYNAIADNSISASVVINDGSTILEPIVENAQLSTVNPADETDVYTSVNEGMIVRLKASMVPVERGAVGMSPFFCHECGTPGCPADMPRVEMIGDDGCATSNFIDETKTVVYGFTGATGTSMLTSAFEVGGWAGKDFAIFTCMVDFCYADDPIELCTDRCSFFSGFGGRRRRDATTNRTRHARSQQMVQSIIHVQTKNYTPPVNSIPVMPSMVRKPVTTIQSKEHACFGSVYFLATVSVLSTIIIASLVTTIVACSKYRKIIHVD